MGYAAQRINAKPTIVQQFHNPQGNQMDATTAKNLMDMSNPIEVAKAVIYTRQIKELTRLGADPLQIAEIIGSNERAVYEVVRESKVDNPMAYLNRYQPTPDEMYTEPRQYTEVLDDGESDRK